LNWNHCEALQAAILEKSQAAIKKNHKLQYLKIFSAVLRVAQLCSTRHTSGNNALVELGALRSRS